MADTFTLVKVFLSVVIFLFLWNIIQVKHIKLLVQELKGDR